MEPPQPPPAPKGTLSFALRKGDSKPMLTPEQRGDESEQRDYILALAANKFTGSAADDEPAKELVIPFRAENRWYKPEDKGKDSQALAQQARAQGQDDAAVQEILRGVQEQRNEADGELEAIPLLVRNQAPGIQDARDETEKFKIDVAQRPDECSLDEYSQVPIELFGAALLKGMGWKEGEGIGGTNKGLVEPIVPIPRPAGLGLGATRYAWWQRN
jgi:G patch domain/KOW motif-containing protein